MNDSTAVCYVCHDDHTYLEASILSFRAASPDIPVTVFVSDVAWDQSPGASRLCAEAAARAGAEIVRGSWGTEKEQRAAALAEMKRRGVRWLFIPDSDELIERRLLDTLLRLSITGAFDHYRVRMKTFWKSPRYQIQPPEEIAPVILIDAQKAEHLHIREYSHERSVTLGFEHGCLMHLSYCGSDERILRKISTWSHKNELVPGWFEKVWLAWDSDRTMRNLHPTHPHCFGFAERISVPEMLRSAQDSRLALREPELPANWPKISVVIALFGGPEDLEACLESLKICGVARHKPEEQVVVVGAKKKGKRYSLVEVSRDHSDNRVPLLHEIIVVDDCSPDDAAEIVKRYPFVKLLRNEENLGFGASNNRGIEAATGDAVLCLNSDTRLPRAALISMGRSLMASGTVGAVGPLSNSVGYFQMFPPTITDLKNLDRFACDFAHRDIPDEDISMLVGFCLLVRKSVFSEVGLFDPRFGKALYGDTDLIYRIQKAGYKTRICHRAFVHHEGSKSLGRTGVHPSLMLATNRRVYENKWRLDLETGFTSQLAGGPDRRKRFNAEREPGLVIQQLRKLAHQADISVCIIAKDEERVIASCLQSLLGVFPQVIVLDTGSTDGTMEIAREKGAEVYESVWKDSFSVARNESISYAKGRWILWIDCDDTVPFATLEAIIVAALNADPKVNGFVVPVQFVEGIPGSGTRVDHVKLFRRDPRHIFEGRIHENILVNLRATGGEVQRIDSPVLHSGYDTSPEGQSKKRKRDRWLLALDLKDRPGHPFPLFNLGMTAYFCGKPKIALGWFRRCLAVSDAQQSHVRKAFALHGMSLRALGRLDAAIQIYEAGLAAVGEDPELRYLLASDLAQLGKLAEARAHLLAMNTDISGFFTSLDISILGYRRFNLLGSICMAMGLEAEAKNYLREGIRSNPANPESTGMLLEVAMRTGDVVAAREAADAEISSRGAGVEWAAMRVAICGLVGTNPDEELLRLLREMPQAIGPGLLLARRQLERGIVDMPLLSHLEGLGCGEAAHHLGTCERSRGNIEAARYHAALAVQLDPGSMAALAGCEEVELAMDDLVPLPEYTGDQGKQVLIGPHVGALGPASLDNSVVVVTFNSAAFITECLRRVLLNLGTNDEVIVVDNCSTDETASLVEVLADTDPRIVYLPQTENHGYSKASNIGILASRGQKITALNPDAFVEDRWLERLGEHLTGHIAAVGPSCDMVAGQQFVGHYLGDRRPPPEEMGRILAAEQGKTSKETKLIMGVCLMMRRDLLDQHGLLCEETSLGADDLEFSWRFRELGYGLHFVPGVFVHHEGGASFATLPSLERRKMIRRSDRALMRRLRAYYGENGVPSSMEIWGCDIFAEAMGR